MKDLKKGAAVMSLEEVRKPHASRQALFDAAFDMSSTLQEKLFQEASCRLRKMCPSFLRNQAKGAKGDTDPNGDPVVGAIQAN